MNSIVSLLEFYFDRGMGDIIVNIVGNGLVAIIVLFVIWSIMLSLMSCHLKDAEYGFQLVCLVI